jgi:hypothetical protein
LRVVDSIAVTSPTALVEEVSAGVLVAVAVEVLISLPL